MELLDKIPEHSVVEINGIDTIYIDRDILKYSRILGQKLSEKHSSRDVQYSIGGNYCFPLICQNIGITMHPL